jgi:DNA-binding beta-propeller fold protein YncE
MGLCWAWLGVTSRAEEPALKLVQTIPLPQITGGMNHFDADGKRQRFFLTGTADRQTLVIDLKAGKVLQTIGRGYSPAAARFAPDLNLLCVSGGGAVTLYDGDSFERVGKVELGSAVDELQYDPKTHRLYAGIQDADAPAIGVIDLAARTLLTKMKLPKPAQAFVLEEQGTRLLANTPGADQVTVIDRHKRAVVAEWKPTEAHANYPAALDEKNHRLFIGCRRPAKLLVLDTDSGKTIASADTGADADDLSFDAATGRIYLACGGGDGAISVVQQDDANHYHALSNVPTAPHARNSLLVPELKRFYLAVPRRQDAPAELRAYATSQ